MKIGRIRPHIQIFAYRIPAADIIIIFFIVFIIQRNLIGGSDRRIDNPYVVIASHRIVYRRISICLCVIDDGGVLRSVIGKKRNFQIPLIGFEYGDLPRCKNE